MHKGFFSKDNILQMFGLFISFFVVGIIYSTIIRPKAEHALFEERVMAAKQSDSGYAPRRNIYVILHNYEQQICFTLLIWATFIIFYKLRNLYHEKNLIDFSFLDLEEGERILPEDALVYRKHIETKLENNPTLVDMMLPKTLSQALLRFHSTSSIQDVSQSIKDLTDSAADQLDSDLSLVRYIAWAIPSVGFVGTVRGIGEALMKADQAIKGDISGVTASLGLAFNSTLIALFLSIILMYIIHLLQSQQDQLIYDIENYCREKLISIMKIPKIV